MLPSFNGEAPLERRDTDVLETNLVSDLRSVRHMFRRGYDFQLDASKLNDLIESWQAKGAVVSGFFALLTADT
jgi:hypothetical protein